MRTSHCPCTNSGVTCICARGTLGDGYGTRIALGCCKPASWHTSHALRVVKVLGSNKGSTCRLEHCWLPTAHVKAMVTCEKFAYKTVLCYMRSLRCHNTMQQAALTKAATCILC